MNSTPVEQLARKGRTARDDGAGRSSIIRPTVGLLSETQVPRTLNPATHAIRREAFLDVAERLIRSKGYEQMSIQDVLDALGASKGAFYHYFDSKEALLEAVIERMTDAALAVVEPIAADPRLPAAAKLQAVFETAGRWKSERSDLLLAVLRSWYAPENDRVRLRVARAGAERLTPLFARIIRQGAAEGAFDPTHPDQAASVLMALFIGSGDAIGQLVLDRQDGIIPLVEAERHVAAYGEAIERILGLPTGSFELIDAASLQVWFA
jgi:AcrR family transcriptional regulator